MTDGTHLTSKTIAVLREMLRKPGQERTAADIGKPLQLSPIATSTQLARLIGAGLVSDRRTHTRRVYRLRGDRLDDARTMVGVEPLRRARRTIVPAHRDEDGAEVWTLRELRQAVARGEEGPGVLALAERVVARAEGTGTR